MKTIFFTRLKTKEKDRMNAGSKAVQDVEAILEGLGGQAIDIPPSVEGHGIRVHISNAKAFKAAVDAKVKGQEGILIIQMPMLTHSIFFSKILKQLQNCRLKIVVLIHDLLFIRENGNYYKYSPHMLRIRLEELSILKIADLVIAHNEKMRNLLVECGIEIRKINCLGIFDYLIEEEIVIDEKKTYIGNVVIAGNLASEKSGYIYKLPCVPQFLLYGANYEDKDYQENVCYMGSYLPDELVTEIQGDFGLVWDGNSPESCCGACGRYLQYNNPHKTSLYLACGIPVIIWNQAALASFVLQYGVGITIESLADLDEKIKAISLEEYNNMKQNAENLSKKIRTGHFTKTALSQIWDI